MHLIGHFRPQSMRGSSSLQIAELLFALGWVGRKEERRVLARATGLAGCIGRLRLGPVLLAAGQYFRSAQRLDFREDRGAEVAWFFFRQFEVGERT